MATPTVFADRSLLDPEAIPPVFDHRDADCEAVQTILSPALWGSGPATALIAGPPGAGKRTIVAVVTARADPPGGRPGPTLVPLTCGPDTTAYDLAIAATNTLVGDEVLASSGYTREAAFGRLHDRIARSPAPPVVRLDGVKRLAPAELDGFLARLLDTTAACGVVGIADDPTARDALGRGVLERFHGEISVEAYDAATERAILAERAERAFRAGACPDATVDRALDRADRGLGTAIELLDSAGERADAAGSETVEPDHVDAASRTVREQRLRDRIADRSRHERLALAAALDGDGPQRFAELYASYRDRCAAAGVEPNRKRSVHNYLDALVTNELLTAERRRSPDAGAHFAYQVRADHDILRQSLAAHEDTQ